MMKLLVDMVWDSARTCGALMGMVQVQQKERFRIPGSRESTLRLVREGVLSEDVAADTLWPALADPRKIVCLPKAATATSTSGGEPQEAGRRYWHARKAEEQLPEIDPDYSTAPFEDTWWETTQILQRFLLLLMNRLFGTHFSGDEEIEPGETDMMLLELDCVTLRRGVDTDFTVVDHAGNRHSFVMDYETIPDGSIELRIARYTLPPLPDDAADQDDETTLHLCLPKTAVISLRGSREVVPQETHIYDGDQVLIHTVETRHMKLADLTVDSLLEPDGLALLPFYIFRYGEDLTNLIEDPAAVVRLMAEFQSICDALDQMESTEAINAVEHGALLELMRKVLRNATLGSVFSEEVFLMASERVLPLATAKAYEVGQMEGRQTGIGEGRRMGRQAGERECILRLVHKGLLSESTGADELGLTADDFQKIYRAAYPNKVPE